MKYQSYENFFVQFSNRTKLAIILSLIEKPRSVNEIAKKINEEQSNVSHHLKNLATCHILNFKQNGKKRIYALNKKTTLPLLKLVKKHNSSYCMIDCSKCTEVCQ